LFKQILWSNNEQAQHWQVLRALACKGCGPLSAFAGGLAM